MTFLITFYYITFDHIVYVFSVITNNKKLYSVLISNATFMFL